MVHIDFDQFDEELQGLLGLRDEGKIALSDDVLNVPIKLLYLKRAVAIDKDASLKQGVNALLARNIGCILIVDSKKICGILTERDLSRKVAGKNLDIEKEKVENYMSANPAVLKESDSVENALRIMDEKRYRHIAIVDEEQVPISVISIKDIIGYLVEFFPNDVLNLPPHPVRIGANERFGA